MSRPAWLGELRTAAAGIDPGLSRMRLALLATASMALAASVMSVVRALAGLTVTAVLFAAVLAMVSNLAVNEPDIRGQRITTALMLPPAATATAVGTLLAPHRVLADVVFVLVMVGAVYARKYAPRGTALGMATFMPYFFTQFLQARVAEIPWLLLAATVGISATLLLRTWVFAERAERTLERLIKAFRAHVHALVVAVVEAVEEVGTDPTPERVEAAMPHVRRARGRLNDTALLVTEHIDRLDDGDERDHDGLAFWVLDVELSAERLAVATGRMLRTSRPPDSATHAALVAGMHALARATEAGIPAAALATVLGLARGAVDELVHDLGELDERVQRVAFAVVRLADAVDLPAGTGVGDLPGEAWPADGEPEKRPDSEDDGDERADGDASDDRDGSRLGLPVRQAVQVGVATSLAIVVGELLSPTRWYWAVVAAFVVFAGTTSRGEILSRGLQRVAGTLGGVIAGVGLVALVGTSHPLALVALFCCAFLALYLVRVSQAMMAFWITAVLGLLYALIGQFSDQALVLRLEETAAGAVLGMLAGWLVLPTGTRQTFLETLDDTVAAVAEVLRASLDQVLGRRPPRPPLELAREMDSTLGTLRMRAKPLDNPLPRRRGRTSYHRALRVLTSVDHYARSLARLSGQARDPGWAATLCPALEQVLANLGGLLRLVRREPAELSSAEVTVDAAEAHAAREPDPERRADLLRVVRLIRRIDQAVVGLAGDLGASGVRTDQGGGRKTR